VEEAEEEKEEEEVNEKEEEQEEGEEQVEKEEEQVEVPLEITPAQVSVRALPLLKSTSECTRRWICCSLNAKQLHSG
jgi:hypothetical protein